jgi:hypothetical protein
VETKHLKMKLFEKTFPLGKEWSYVDAHNICHRHFYKDAWVAKHTDTYITWECRGEPEVSKFD